MAPPNVRMSDQKARLCAAAKAMVAGHGVPLEIFFKIDATSPAREIVAPYMGINGGARTVPCEKTGGLLMVLKCHLGQAPFPDCHPGG